MAAVTLASVGFGSAQTPPAAQSAAPAQPPGPNTWQIDSNHSAANFSVKHMMVSTVRGTLGRVSGTVEYDGTKVESIKADVGIDINGVNTGVQGRDNDLRSANFFDVATYPTATFKSKRAEAAGAGRFRLIGDLTMHGVTKEVTLDVEGPSAPLKTQNGALRIGASATTKINRRDFGLNYNRLVEAAAVVGDDIQVTIDIELTKRPAA
ncbi:MAG: hypothetical protein A3H96_04090 [Acidobacteria bacterium RIFCSPLOWO2_02_FULL_67_36]|nr:MAG: hypothetical protein A3H96_04090 [Acidobacteria bacterium RIFCSPLOWO2_02_FULL_67_36]OFW19798.1 MAG: hypothetical protein A3G21_12975 [Acidobacteria bacterium RIFCSPLOWO2_12_FULL_66_21]